MTEAAQLSLFPLTTYALLKHALEDLGVNLCLIIHAANLRGKNVLGELCNCVRRVYRGVVLLETKFREILTSFANGHFIFSEHI